MSTPSFTSLLQDIRSCTHCTKSLPFGPRPVVQANPKAKILIVGQAPGRKAHETGIPFDDPSGNRLRDWMGVDREIFYNSSKISIVPMGFCFPGSGKSGDLPPRPECADKWRTTLLNQLSNIELTLIIGQYAMDWHLGADREKTLTATVQNWKNYWPSKLVLPHPSPRNNIWLKKNAWFEKELLPPLKKRVQQLL